MGVDAGQLRTVFPDGDGSTFNALQLHFHAPSEHTVNGKYMDLEMHVVHLHDSGTRFSVLGFMFDVEEGGNSENEFLKSIAVE
jgi:carbonic anhydrase